MLKIHNISKSFGKSEVLKNCSLDIESNEFVALLGESGSGKSTLLRVIAGFETPNKGSVNLGDRTLVDTSTFVKPEDRRVGVIFQNYALFPHLNIRKNISFGIKKTERKNNKTVDELLALFELEEHQFKLPHSLSGGQQQRVAIARALAVNPKVLLMDEPFSNLDQSLRRKVRQEIKRMHQQINIPIILVSHDPEDALELADKVAVLQNGEIVQFDTPEKLYYYPANNYVADLLGPNTLFNDRFVRPEQISFQGNDFSGKVLKTSFSLRGNMITIATDSTAFLAYDYYRKYKIGDVISFSIDAVPVK